jgi:hypothetical protein
MSEWDELATFDLWVEKLDALLDEARRTLTDQDSAVEIQRRLCSFQLNSPRDARFRKLNRIATEAVTSIAAQSITQAIERIADRFNEFDDVALQSRSVTAEPQRNLTIMNLDHPTTIVASLTETVDVLNELRDGFTPDSSTGEIAKHVTTTIMALTQLRDAIGKSNIEHPQALRDACSQFLNRATGSEAATSVGDRLSPRNVFTHPSQSNCP